MHYVECWKLSNVLANIAVVIFRVNIHAHPWKPKFYTEFQLQSPKEKTFTLFTLLCVLL
jgi:pyoverdine/dityrosine biosynthesis protein Dit1